jgi:serine/threonine-protein kinase HipA
LASRTWLHWGLPDEQKYRKSYSAIAQAIRLFCAPPTKFKAHCHSYSIVTLSSIVGNGDAHLKNFGLLYSDPTRCTARSGLRHRQHRGLYSRGRIGAGLASNKSLFASRQGLLDFAQVCDVAQPEAMIREQLSALERVLARSTELSERALHVVVAIRHCAAPFMQAFG